MPIEFLCIDDEDEATLKPYLDVVAAQSDEIHFDLQSPGDIGDLVVSFSKQAPDGLILDLRLEKKVGYHGPTLAQELRTRMSGLEIPSFPIVLWSVNAYLQKSFVRDDTAQDLFDCIYEKDELVQADHPKQAAMELISLVHGYRKIQGQIAKHNKSIAPLLGLPEEEKELLDPRIGDIFNETDEPKSIHQYARYILQEIVISQGPLINEDVLAARLGIDRKSSPGWEKVKALISERSAYRGVFHEAWPGWWAYKVEEWWQGLNAPGSLRRLGATERVEVLRKIFGDLSPATPIEKSYSDRFWTICKGYNAPLDPIDGLLAASAELKAWQEPPYLSIKAALERVGRDKGWRPHPLEQERLQQLKATKRA